MFTTELEAAQAYDRESVTRKGVDAITNFDLSHYTELLSSEDLEEAKRRGLLSAPELAAAEESADFGAWQEVPVQELSDMSMAALLQGMSCRLHSLPPTAHGRSSKHLGLLPELRLAGFCRHRRPGAGGAAGSHDHRQLGRPAAARLQQHARHAEST